MNCIIGTDKLTCKILEEFAGESPSLNLVGAFSDTVSVKKLLTGRQDIDLVFLDIETLGTGMLAFINNLKYKPSIIIISTNDKEIPESFESNVIDYLIKPVNFSKFSKAIYKTRKYCAGHETGNNENDEIFIKQGLSLVKLKIKDLIYIEALENHVSLNTADESFSIHFTIKAIENQLPPKIFTRVHKSYIVNRRMIKTIKENSLEILVGHEVKNIPLDETFKPDLTRD